MKYNVSETFLRVSGGLDNRHPYIQKVEYREYEDGSNKLVRGKPLYLGQKKQELLPMHSIALTAIEELIFYAPKIPK